MNKTFTNKESISEELLVLKKQCEAVAKYIKQKQKCFPVYLLLGLPQCGKTQLLSHSGLEFNTIIPAFSNKQKNPLLTPQHKHGTYEHTAMHSNAGTNRQGYCHWWFTENGIYLDPPSHFYKPDSFFSHSELWSYLIKFIKKQRRLKLAKIILVVSSETIVGQNPEQLTAAFKPLKQTITELSQQLKQVLPFTLIIAKADLITGFEAYFNNILSEERECILGFPLQEVTANNDKNTYSEQSITDRFQLRFDLLVDEINKNLLRRLHEEHNIQKRYDIFEFPIQLHALKEKLLYLVHDFVEKTTYCELIKPVGIYFTSSMQPGSNIDALADIFSNIISNSNRITRTPRRQKSYFIRELLAGVKPQTKQRQPDKKRHTRKLLKRLSHWQSITAIAISLVIVISVTFYSYSVYQKKMTIVQQGMTDLTAYRAAAQKIKASSQDIRPTLTALNLLAEAAEKFDKSNTSLFANIFLPESYFLKNKVFKTYKHALQTYLLPRIRVTLEHDLNNPRQTASQQYSALKAYLMLGDHKHLEPLYILNWLHTQKQLNIGNNPQQVKQFQTLLNAALNTISKPIKLNQNAIAHVRKNLNTYPDSMLIYLIFKDAAMNTTQQDITIYSQIANIQTKSEQDNPLQIPYFYTIGGFQKIFLKEIQQLPQLAKQEQWVLGSDPLPNAAYQQIANDVINMYFNDYANWWALYMRKLTINNIDNLQKLLQLTNAAADDNNLLMALKSINQNTAPQKLLTIAAQSQKQLGNLNNTILYAIKAKISSQLKGVHQLFNQNTEQPSQKLLDINNAIINLQQYLGAIDQATDPKQAAFQVTQLRFKHPKKADPITQLLSLTNNTPDPVNSWLNILANRSWQLLMKNTREYVNQQWQADITNFYNDKLKDRYPLYSDSTKQANLKDFINFFSPHGILDNFYARYLKAFINTQASDWQWQTIDGESLSSSMNIIELLERAQIIKQMFFPNDSANFDVKFSLQALAMEPIIKSIHFDINGQTLVDKQGTSNLTQFNWPDMKHSNKTVLAINTINGKHVKDIEKGPWGLFYLIAKSHLIPSNDPRKYMLIFDVGGNQAKYQLLAQNEINPFIPGILDQFRMVNNI